MNECDVSTAAEPCAPIDCAKDAVEIPLTNAVVRSWRATDLESLVRHANDRSVWRNVRDRFPHPYTENDGRNWLEFVAAQSPETSLAIAVDGQAVGSIGLELRSDIHRRSAEIGYWLGREFWGRGIATEAVRAVSEFAFAQFDLCRLYAGVIEWNQASMRVLEKAGYQREGLLRAAVTKDGQTVDEVLYALVRRP